MSAATPTLRVGGASVADAADEVPSAPIPDDSPEAGDVVARRSHVGLGSLVGAMAGLWGLLIGLKPLHDNSFLTHLATGRIILETGSVPTTDPYSFTAGGDPWTVQSWLASVIYAGAEQVGGFDGVRLVNGVLCALLGVAVWLLTARSRSFLVRFAVTAVVMVAATSLWSGRPLLFGLLGLAAVLLAADEQLDPRWLVPVCWVWVNTHGSFPLAVLVIVLLAVGRRLDEGTWGPEVRVLKWAAIGVAAGALNPLGPRLLLFPLTLVTKTEAFQSIVEWQPPTYQALIDYWVVGLLFVAVLGLVRTPSWRSALPVVAFGAMAVTSARNLAPFVLVVTPVLAGAVPRLGVDIGSIRRPSFRVGLAALAAAGALFVGVSLGRPDLALDAYPEEQMAWMEDEGLWSSTSRVMAPDYVGNYREARRGEEANVFLDDRVDMYPLEVISDYKVVLEVRPGWQEVLADREITAVLWEADTPLGAALETSADWTIVHRDAPWVVAVPKSSR